MEDGLFHFRKFGRLKFKKGGIEISLFYIKNAIFAINVCIPFQIWEKTASLEADGNRKHGRKYDRTYCTRNQASLRT